MFGFQPRIDDDLPDSQDLRPYDVLFVVWMASDHPFPVATPTPSQHQHHYHHASVLGCRFPEEDDMDNDGDVRPCLNSGEKCASTSHSDICNRDRVIRMEATSSDKPSYEGVHIADTVGYELGELNDSNLVEG